MKRAIEAFKIWHGMLTSIYGKQFVFSTLCKKSKTQRKLRIRKKRFISTVTQEKECPAR